MSEANPTNIAVWFEIPASDLERAVAFYEDLFATRLRRETIAGAALAIFPSEGPGVSGAIVKGPHFRPGEGPVVYLNGNGRLDAMLERVPRLGGRIAVPKVALPEGMGAFAHIIDTEGNRVGLHTM
ncbi:MAG TPA: VOC family protein [Stellaceae bacterium]|nr:VOC family protein [Stellaceae bacterium]